MKTNSPTHEEVAQRAQEIWRSRGCPDGCDTEIWLEAERKLSESNSAPNSPSNLQSRIKEDPRSNVTVGASGNGLSASERPLQGVTSNVAETGARASQQNSQQKKEARAPKLPAKSAPKPAPTESGKPLWNKPHSS